MPLSGPVALPVTVAAFLGASCLRCRTHRGPQSVTPTRWRFIVVKPDRAYCASVPWGPLFTTSRDAVAPTQPPGRVVAVWGTLGLVHTRHSLFELRLCTCPPPTRTREYPISSLRESFFFFYRLSAAGLPTCRTASRPGNVAREVSQQFCFPSRFSGVAMEWCAAHFLHMH